MRRKPRGKVTITSEHGGETVSVGEIELGKAPLSIQLPLESYSIKIQISQGQTEIHHVELKKNEHKRIFVRTLEKLS